MYVCARVCVCMCLFYARVYIFDMARNNIYIEIIKKKKN